MDVILLQKVDNLGNLGDRVNVRPGYGRNFLIPHGKAAPATAKNVAEFEARRAELEKQAFELLSAAEQRKVKIEALRGITIEAKTGEEGKLFGSVGTVDIADALTAAGVEVERKEIRLPEEGVFRMIGEYTIEIHVHADINVELTVTIKEES